MASRAARPTPDIAPSARGRGQWAYERLHEAIREGTITPGHRLMEAELSESFGISRTPLREAMRRLQAEGLLEPAPGGGLAVVVYDTGAIAEFYAMRESLEGTAAALAAQHADATERGILEALMEGMRTLPEDPRLHARENEALHEHIHRAAHNRFLLKSLRALLNFVPLLGRTTYHDPGRIPLSLAEHEALAAAILARDPVRAEAAARAHIRSALESRMRVVAADVRDAARRRSARPAPRRPAGPRPRDAA